MIGRVKKDVEEARCWKVSFKQGTEYRFEGTFEDVIKLWYRVKDMIDYVEATDINGVVPCLITITTVD